MQNEIKKLALYFVLLFGVGALIHALVSWVDSLKSSPISASTSVLEIVGIVVVGLGWLWLGFIAARALVEVYREELGDFDGNWHLTLNELLLATLVTGMLMLVAQTLCVASIRPYGISIAFVLGVYFTIDLLISARKGCDTGALKVVSAVGMVFKIAGWIAFALLLYKSSEPQFSNRLLFTYGDNLPDLAELSILSMIRFGLLCLPAGYLIVSFIAKLNTVPKTVDNAPAETLRQLLDAKRA